jgi:hypothetical protein
MLLTLAAEATNVGVDVVTLVSPGTKRRTLEVLQSALIGTVAYIAGDVALVLRTGVVLDRVIDGRLLALKAIHEGRVGLTPIVGISGYNTQFILLSSEIVSGSEP